MTNWCVNGAEEGDDPMAANFWTPRVNPGDRRAYTQIRPGLAKRLGRRPEPQPDAGHDLGRLRRRVALVQQRGVRRAGRGLGARGQERGLDRRTRSRTSSSRTTSTRSAATSCGRLARTCATARDASGARTSGSRSYFFARGRDGPRPDQGVPRQRGASGADGPDRRRALLGGRQLGRRQLLPQGDHRLLVRGRVRPSSQPDADAARGRRRDRHPRQHRRPGSRRATTITVGWNGRESRERRRSPRSSNAAEPEPERPPDRAARRRRTRVGEAVNGGTCASGSGSSAELRERGPARGERVRKRQLRTPRGGARLQPRQDARRSCR